MRGVPLYHLIDDWWQKLERMLIVIIITAMTLVTFAYTILNNLYTFFYTLAATFPFAQTVLFRIGDGLLDTTYALSWSNAFSKACFAWLIFLGMAYGVRIGGHIGVNILIKRCHNAHQRIIALIGLSACLGYGGIFFVASLEWVYTFYLLSIEAEDLQPLRILKWHIAIIVPLGFLSIMLRYIEIGYRILTHQQMGLSLANEVDEATQNETTSALEHQ